MDNQKKGQVVQKTKEKQQMAQRTRTMSKYNKEQIRWTNRKRTKGQISNRTKSTMNDNYNAREIQTQKIHGVVLNSTIQRKRNDVYLANAFITKYHGVELREEITKLL